jgi:hypothetical protein
MGVPSSRIYRFSTTENNLKAMSVFVAKTHAWMIIIETKLLLNATEDGSRFRAELIEVNAIKQPNLNKKMKTKI